MNELKIEDVELGQEYIHSKLDTISTVTNKTQNSVELFNQTDRNNCYLSGQKDADGVVQRSGKRKGVDGKNWYTLQDFNKTFNMKENNFQAMFKRMDEEKKEAEVEYARIMEEDKNKDLMDIMPADFKHTKRSILKRSILRTLEAATKMLNTCGLYGERIFTQKEVARYMIRGTSYSNFYLAYMFVPRTKDLWMDYAMKYHEQKGRAEPDYKVFEKENAEQIKIHGDLDYILRGLIQDWEQYENRQKVKRGEPVHDYDIEKDGFPRTGRGSLCHLFIPVKGDWPKKEWKDEFKLQNPRNKKNVTYKIIEYKKADDVYKCLNDKGKTVFLIKYQEVADAWDALFSSNKEIFAGWWNKVMILK